MSLIMDAGVLQDLNANCWQKLRLSNANVQNTNKEMMFSAARYILTQHSCIYIGDCGEAKKFVITWSNISKLSNYLFQYFKDDPVKYFFYSEIILYFASYMIDNYNTKKIDLVTVRLKYIEKALVYRFSQVLNIDEELAYIELLNWNAYSLKNMLYCLFESIDFPLNLSKDTFFKYVKRRRNTSFYEDSSERIIKHCGWLERRHADCLLLRLNTFFITNVFEALKKGMIFKLDQFILSEDSCSKELLDIVLFSHYLEIWLMQILTYKSPEYVNLIMETMCVSYQLYVHDNKLKMIDLFFVIECAHNCFLKELMMKNIETCCSSKMELRSLKCGGSEKICKKFYNLAPAGIYGTLAFISNSISKIISEYK